MCSLQNIFYWNKIYKISTKYQAAGGPAQAQGLSGPGQARAQKESEGCFMRVHHGPVAGSGPNKWGLEAKQIKLIMCLTKTKIEKQN